LPWHGYARSRRAARVAATAIPLATVPATALVLCDIASLANAWTRRRLRIRLSPAIRHSPGLWLLPHLRLLARLRLLACLWLLARLWLLPLGRGPAGLRRRSRPLRRLAPPTAAPWLGAALTLPALATAL